MLVMRDLLGPREPCGVRGFAAAPSLPVCGCAMRVELIPQAANVLFDVPDETHEEIITLIDAVTKASQTQAPDLAAAFGAWCWLVYTVHGDVIEVLDVGCAW
jgi:hypothetical protein